MHPSLVLPASESGLQSTWSNFDGTQTLYLSRSPTLNQITLTLSNPTPAAYRLAKGEPRAYGELPAGQSAIYVFFNGLLDDDEIAAIQWTANGSTPWAAVCHDDVNGRYWALAPTRDVPFGQGVALAFRLDRVMTSHADAHPHHLDIELSGVPGLADAQAALQQFVFVSNPPTPENQALNLLVGFAGRNSVYTFHEQDWPDNDLCLYLTNPAPQALVPGGRDAWKRTPTFQLSLVFGEGPGALSRLDNAEAINVNIRNAFGNVWKPVVKQRQGEVPYWIMQPSENGGGTVLGCGQNATIAFNLTDIVAQVPAGLTYAYISYRDIPGYNDGYYAIEILKVDPVVILDLSATPTSFASPTPPAYIALAYSVQNATRASISNTPYTHLVPPGVYSDRYVTTVHSTTTYTLTAINERTGQQRTKSVTVEVTPDIPSLSPVGMIALWHGTADNVPRGWALCNGEHGTPDLRGRFIVAASASGNYSQGSRGDGILRLQESQLPAHTHAASTSQDGEHYHTTVFNHRGFDTDGSGQGLTNNPDAGTSSFARATDQKGIHGHRVYVGATGSGAPIQIVPAYYALHYIMRIA